MLVILRLARLFFIFSDTSSRRVVIYKISQRDSCLSYRGPLCYGNGSIVHWRTVQSKMRSEVQRNARLALKPSPVFYSVYILRLRLPQRCYYPVQSTMASVGHHSAAAFYLLTFSSRERNQHETCCVLHRGAAAAPTSIISL